MTPRVLVAGVGNIFFSDDGFGVEVVNRLADAPVPENVRIADFGIRGVHLAYELIDDYDTLVLVDALQRDEPPGTITVIEPDPDDLDGAVPMDAHSMDPRTVFATLAELGGSLDRVVIVGCEPLTVEDGMGLSEPVAAAVDDAARAVLDVVADLCGAVTRQGGQ